MFNDQSNSNLKEGNEVYFGNKSPNQAEPERVIEDEVE